MTVFIATFLAIPFLTKDRKVTLEEIEQTIKPYIDEKIIKKVEDSTLYKNYKINPSSFDGYLSYGPVSYMNVQEITVFKEKDKKQRQRVLEKIQEYINKKIVTFEGYGPKQVELLKNAIVQIKGDYIFCIILEEKDSLLSDLENLF